MKKIILLQICLFIAAFSQAQRFFYVAPGNIAERLIKEDLLKASQFVTRSPLMSDYSIHTEISFKKETNTASLKIILKDSATFKTIYQTNEEYAFRTTRLDPQILLYMAMKTLIEEQIGRIIFWAKDDHLNGGMKNIPLAPAKS
jgi:hypothetical protein